MVSIADKVNTSRTATAIQSLMFSSPETFHALNSATLAKGDAIAVARVAGIQGAKRTADLIPLAHPGLQITGVEIDILPFPRFNKLMREDAVSLPVDPTRQKAFIPLQIARVAKHGGVLITATVSCHGKTGVEMEALTAANIAGLTMYDMLKGIDKGMVLREGRVTEKEGGKSGSWRYNWAKGEVVSEAADDVGSKVMNTLDTEPGLIRLFRGLPPPDSSYLKGGVRIRKHRAPPDPKSRGGGGDAMDWDEKD